MDLTAAAAPRSDQLNGDDLLSGPRTFTIEDVREGSDEQPVQVHLAELPGRPFKPCRSMIRVFIEVWDSETSGFKGRRLTLYREPKVRFGGEMVGGIRISHMSHIDKPKTVYLTVAKQKKAPFTVQPLPAAPKPDPRIAALTDEWHKADPERRAAIEAEVAAIKSGASA